MKQSSKITTAMTMTPRNIDFLNRMKANHNVPKSLMARELLNLFQESILFDPSLLPVFERYISRYDIQQNLSRYAGKMSDIYEISLREDFVEKSKHRYKRSS